MSDLLVAEVADSSKITEESTVSLNLNNTENDSWFGRDKGLHLVTSFIATTLITNINKKSFNMNSSESKNTGVGIVFSLGITKEIFDSRQKNNIFSWKDLVANVTGILLGVAILEIN